ncbi:MAG: hypothetical protein JXB49_16445, partial [Bacteroidales bacterium]|nr:hypothetical protein [Bacteroidales bacterium]
MLKRIENIYIIIIILLSTSFFSLSFLGPLAKGFEILGILFTFALLALYLVYSDQKLFKHNFTTYIVLVFLSLITSMSMAYYSRGQSIADTLLAQRAIYYYIFYFLLHQLKIKPKDLEQIFIFFGLLSILLYLVQFFLYPKVIFDVFMLPDRGTIRIYMQGSSYVSIAYLMCIQGFFRTNKIGYLILVLIFFSNFVLLGARETMAIMSLVLILFLLFSKKVKSRIFIGILVLFGIGLIFILFQEIFLALIVQSKRDTSLGTGYIRFAAAKYFLTDFFNTPVAYFTGNGMYSNNSSYGVEISRIMSKRFFLGDIGIIGNYAIYGPLFVIGVLGICFKSIKSKIQENFIYIKYMFIVIILSLLTGGAFADADFIVFIMCLLYLIDVSIFTQHSTANTELLTRQ